MKIKPRKQGKNNLKADPYSNLKCEILKHIARLHNETGSVPGQSTFAQQTGIQKADWVGKIWARWGDAVKEAGFEANTLQTGLDRDFLFQCVAELCEELGRFPVKTEFLMKARSHEGFPAYNTIMRPFGTKSLLVLEFRNWLEQHPEFSHLIDVLPNVSAESSSNSKSTTDGLVYLLKSGSFHKIGRSNNIEKRIKQITVSLPEDVTLEHAIATDDPSGIEAYWHRRFSEKRANGEWFSLDRDDVRAFKRRKFQ